MIRFLSNESAPQLDKLRKRLERNTSSLIGLFRERVTLAREIGKIKEENSIPIRIRQRERELLDSVRDMDEVSRSIISSLFEFTIVNESSLEGNSRLSEKSLELSGEKGQLMLLAGLLISSPGVEAYTLDQLPEPLELGIQANGGHIVFDDIENPDLVVGIGIMVPCGVAIDCSGTMRIDIHCLKSPKPRKILVRQR